MKVVPRVGLFAVAAAALLPAVWQVVSHMPAFGAHPLPYGDAIAAAAPGERHVLNMVSAVNFDYRGVDTLGEECMLLAAVTGAVVLLRGGRGEDRLAASGWVAGRRIARRSDAVAMLCRALAAPVLVFAVYMALHATVTPGGGFQGGVMFASGLLLLFVGDSYRVWRVLVPFEVAAVLEAAGAALFALCGLAPMLFGRAFMQNVLPFGRAGDMLSGGLMQVENAGVFLAVGGGFTALFLEFLEETRQAKPGDDRGEE